MQGREILKKVGSRIGSTLFEGKRRHFAFLLGLGYGYLQYKFFDDLLMHRAKLYDSNLESMSKILNNVFF